MSSFRNENRDLLRRLRTPGIIIAVACCSALVLFFMLRQSAPSLNQTTYPQGPTPAPKSYASHIFPLSETPANDQAIPNVTPIANTPPSATPINTDTVDLEPSVEFVQNIEIGHILGDRDAPVVITEFSDFL